MAYWMTYFRIRSPGYSGGWESETARKDFEAESRALFLKEGWDIHPGGNGVSDTVVKGQQDLYLHPMSFSGVVMEEEVPSLQKLFSTAKAFQCYAVDRYEEYRELDDEGYWAELETRRHEITAELLEQYKTKRSNLYITDGVGLYVAKKFSVHRLSDKDGKHNIAHRFVDEVIDELLQQGKLIAVETVRGTGIRTATRQELKLRGRQEPEDHMTIKMEGW